MPPACNGNESGNAFASQSKDANQQKAAEATLYFYLGRVASGTTSAQLKALLTAQAKTITDKTAGDMMNKCVDGVQSKVPLLQTLTPAPAAAAPAKKP